MNDIIEFLKARYAEDVQLLKLQNEHLSGLDRPFDLENPTDPFRALIDIESKQRILAEVSGSRYLESWSAAQTVMNALALPYAWHSDYSPGWTKGIYS